MDKNLFDSLLDSVNEMVAIENGEKEPNPSNVHFHKIPNVKSIRKSFKMKQSEFADIIGVSAATVQSWELNRRIPNGAALKMLFLIEKKPSIINELKSL